MYRIDQCGYAIWAYPRGNAVAKIEHVARAFAKIGENGRYLLANLFG